MEQPSFTKACQNAKIKIYKHTQTTKQTHTQTSKKTTTFLSTVQPKNTSKTSQIHLNKPSLRFLRGKKNKKRCLLHLQVIPVVVIVVIQPRGALVIRAHGKEIRFLRWGRWLGPGRENWGCRMAYLLVGKKTIGTTWGKKYVLIYHKSKSFSLTWSQWF